MAWQAALLGGAADLAGSLTASALSYKAFKKQHKFQKDLARKGVQWRVQDLREAGLNPILALNPGGGIAAAGGSAVPGPQMGIRGGGEAVSSALAARLQRKQIPLLEQQVAESEARESANWAAAYRDNQQGMVNAVEWRLRNTLMPAALRQAAFDATTAGGYLREFRRIMEGLGGIGSGPIRRRR